MRTVKLFTLGCKANQYDTQVIREDLLQSGLKEEKTNKPADICIINTCTVTSSADAKSRHLINHAIRSNPGAKIIITGCYAELDRDKIKHISSDALVVKNKDKNRIARMLGFAKRSLGNVGVTGFSEHTRAFLKVQDGCDNFCAYCRVPLARGRSRSRAITEIVNEARRIVASGFKEIVLTGICLGDYGKGLKEKVNLCSLIRELEKIEGLVRLRLSSIEVSDVSDELIELIARSKKVSKHLHIPLQSGDPEISKAMNRKTIPEEFVSVIKKIKTKIKNASITTDVLVGFPGESGENFLNTVRLIKKMNPLKVHVFPFSARPRTPAADMENKIDYCVIKERVAMLDEVSAECARKYIAKYIGKKLDVLVEQRIPGSNSSWQGFSSNYIKVCFTSKKNIRNNLVEVILQKYSPGVSRGILLRK